jgi:hypothetical protein
VGKRRGDQENHRDGLPLLVLHFECDPYLRICC